MPQTVLPLTPAPGSPNDISVNKAQPGKGGDAGGRFEEVSRAEQKKLDAKAKEGQDQARSAEEKRADGSDEEVIESERVAAEKAGDADADPGANAEEKGVLEDQSTAVEIDAEPVDSAMAPLTFIDLQSMAVPANESVKAMNASAAGANLAAGLSNSKPVVAGQINGSQGGSPGLQLAEALGSVMGGEGNRSADSAGSPRFQATFELASQLQSSPASRLAADVSTNPSAKLATDGMVPLKSYATSIDVPVGHAEWGDKLVGKLSWLTARNMSVAEIHLTPADLGPMEVKVRVQNEQANITVHAANPVVRDQLELHSHRLRDMLGEQGLNLAKFDVSDSPQQQAGDQGTGTDAEGGAGERGGQLSAVDADEDLVSGALDLSWNGEIDVFA